MIRGQKSVRGGIEDFLCPFENFYMTAGAGEIPTHYGNMASDIRGSVPGAKEPYYAPCTVVCYAVYPESGQAMWQSVNKVRFANGRIDYATFCTVHDSSFDAYVGLRIPQGNQIGNMGTKGYATGVHCHIEVSQSADKTWFKNSYGNWMFNNEYDIEDCFFMDNVNILHGMGNWKYLKDVPVQEKERVDQILNPGSYVQIPGTFEVIDINIPDNTALVRIDGKDYWLSSVPLLEVEKGE